MRSVAYFVVLLVTLGCPVAIAQIQLEEVAIQRGVDHYHRGLTGGGIAVFDFNNDGFQDLYLTGGRFKDKLYKNNGNGTFVNVASYAGLDTTIFYNTMAVVTGDINNDGHRDIFVATDQLRHHLLFVNNGDGTFAEVSQPAGITSLEWGMGGVFADFNLDGWLDLYIINYVQNQQAVLDEQGEVIGFGHSCFSNRLYLNNGDLTFTDATQATQTGDTGCGLAVIATDLNNDHLSDLLVANDFGEWVSPNAGLVNKFPNMAFSNTSASLGLDAAIYGMGIAEGDYNRDGWNDYYVTNLGRNILYTGHPDGSFRDSATEAGVENTFAADELATSWGAAFVDLDHDGHDDLVVSNGDIPAARFIANAADDPDKLYKNRGDGTFEDISSATGFANLQRGRGLAIGDLDNDGDQEVIVAIAAENNDSGRLLIYDNQTITSHHWLKVMLQGMQANRDGFGAKVHLFDQGQQWMRELNSGTSHASQHASLLHFGLGATSMIDSMVVTWPGGNRQVFFDIATDQVIRVVEDDPAYFIAGCTDTAADNYDPSARYDYGCFTVVPGCMDQDSPGFDLNANVATEDCGQPVITGIGSAPVTPWLMYPNPVRDFLVIELDEVGEVDLELIDLAGKVHYSASFQHRHSMARISQWPPGLYIVRLYVQHQVYTKKILLR